MEMFSRWYQQMERQGMRFSGLEVEHIDISNVARYWWQQEKDGEWSLSKDFPRPVLPWPDAWIEYKYPDSLNLYFGGVFWSVELEEEYWKKAIEERAFLYYADKKTPGAIIDSSDLDPAFAQAVEQGILCRWIQGAFLWIMNASVVRNVSSHIIHLTPQGDVIKSLSLTQPYEPFESHPLVTFFPFMYAISLLNCKNTSLVAAEYDRATKRRAIKRKVPSVIFKQLHVKPMGRKAQPAQQGEPSGEYLKRRLHICRGHFKDYRAGGGLFGRYKGLYWWSQQLRGDADQGIVVKDYIVEQVD